jgi:transcriptional/translational regulatory protein YebC/TACO1
VEAAKLQLVSSKIVQVPKNRKELRGRDAEVCLNLVDALDEHDDVATVYSDFDVPEDELQRIANAS